MPKKTSKKDYSLYIIGAAVLLIAVVGFSNTGEFKAMGPGGGADKSSEKSSTNNPWKSVNSSTATCVVELANCKRSQTSINDLRAELNDANSTIDLLQTQLNECQAQEFSINRGETFWFDGKLIELVDTIDGGDYQAAKITVNGQLDTITIHEGFTELNGVNINVMEVWCCVESKDKAILKVY